MRLRLVLSGEFKQPYVSHHRDRRDYYPGDSVLVTDAICFPTVVNIERKIVAGNARASE
ncbi:MAG: hypothetical protein IIC29_05670 [Chloroflexi bacterium]|nr:hypothetical protein [Chloroflexota bacterium]MCH8818071.1 hypothetical protein [Chloroflexota bacterium]